MANSNDAIKAMLGTAPARSTAEAGKPGNPQNAPALKSIATNGALMTQNISKLTQTLAQITARWGV